MIILVYIYVYKSIMLEKETELYLLQCKKCHKWQHAVCYNLYIPNESAYESYARESVHYCNDCCVRVWIILSNAENSFLNI